MDYEVWSKLRAEMAVEFIVIELADRMISHTEGRERALSGQRFKTQDYLTVEHNMGGALIAIEKLGYEIVKKSKP